VNDAYREAVRAAVAPGARDLGRIALTGELPAFAGEAVVDVDVHEPRRVTTAALASWADERDVAIAGVAPWALALGPPDANPLFARTHARESEMDHVRSYTPAVAELADVRAAIETQLAPWLPLGATRRALLRLRAGRDPAATRATLDDLDRRSAAFAGAVPSDVLERYVPGVRALATRCARAAADFRALAFLTKLAHAAVVHRCLPDVAPLVEDPTAAALAADVVAKLETDRTIFAFANDWAADDALAPFVTYRGVRIDDLASRLLLRRFGHPAFQDE
jgi:hypothetical protein